MPVALQSPVPRSETPSSFPAPRPLTPSGVGAFQPTPTWWRRDVTRRSAALFAFALAVILVMLSAGGAMAQVDSDNDGISDSDERSAGTDPVVGDTDLDGLPDGVEVELGTNPLSADSDGDGATDAEEFLAGDDPLVASGAPGVVAVTQVPATVVGGTDVQVGVDRAVDVPVTVSPAAEEVVPDTLAFDDGSRSRSPLVGLYVAVAVLMAAGMLVVVARSPQLHADKPF